MELPQDQREARIYSADKPMMHTQAQVRSASQLVQQAEKAAAGAAMENTLASEVISEAVSAAGQVQ